MEKKRIWAMALVVVMLSSCSLFKNTSKEKVLTKQNVEVEVQKEVVKEDKSTSHIIHVKDEKSGTETVIEVTGGVKVDPSGVITGGMAKAVIKRSDSVKTIHLQAIQNDVKVTEKVDSVFKEKLTEKVNTSKSLPSSKTYWFAIGGIILFGLMIWGLNRLK